MTKLTINFQGIEIEVEGNFIAGDPGVYTYSNGDPGYPGTPDEFEIEEISIGDQDAYNFFDSLYLKTNAGYYTAIDEIMDLCLKELS